MGISNRLEALTRAVTPLLTNILTAFRTKNRRSAVGYRDRYVLDQLESRQLLSVSIISNAVIAAGSTPVDSTAVNNTAFFVATDGTHGTELFETAAGATSLFDINPGSGSSSPANLTDVNGILYFSANDGSGQALWKTDGTASGTVEVSSTSPLALFNVNGVLYFPTSSGVWKTDGTSGGTVLLTSDTLSTGIGHAVPFVDIFGQIYFAASDSGSGSELWVTNGTAAGTTQVVDIDPGAASSDPQELTNLGGTLFFSANDGVHGRALWQLEPDGEILEYTGTPGSVTWTGPGYESDGGWFEIVDGSGINYWEGWTVDTTDTDNNAPVIPQPTDLMIAGNGIYFNAAAPGSTDQPDFWDTDGTDDGTSDLSLAPGGSSLVLANSLGTTSSGGVANFFFDLAGNSGGQQLRSLHFDGSRNIQIVGDHLLHNFSAADSQLGNFAFVNNALYFTSYDSSDGLQLWISAGTAGTTSLLTTFPSTALSSSNLDLTGANGEVYFSVDDSANGVTLWQSNGTAAGTTSVDTISSDATFSGGGGSGLLGTGSGVIYFKPINRKVEPYPPPDNVPASVSFGSPGGTGTGSPFVELNSDHDEHDLDSHGGPVEDRTGNWNGTVAVPRITIGGSLDPDLKDLSLILSGSGSGSLLLGYPNTIRVWNITNPSSPFVISSGQSQTINPYANGTIIQLGIEGINVSTSLNDTTVTASFHASTGSTYTASTTLTVAGFAEYIDADNNNGYADPDASNIEGADKQNPDATGKIVGLDNGDSDGDGIPDFADGYNLDGTQGDADDSAGSNVRFVPMVIQLDSPIDVTKATFTFSYSGSDPLGVNNSTGTYLLPVDSSGHTGYLRLWTKDGSQERDGRDVSLGGDYVVPGETYTATSLGFTGENVNGEVTLWVEGVRAVDATDDANRTITMAANPDSSQTFETLKPARAEVSVIAPPPQTPVELNATVTSSDSVNLTWVDDADDQTGYQIQRALDDQFETGVVDIAVNNWQQKSITDSPTPGTTYYYQIAAVNQESLSGYSNIVSADLPQGLDQITFTNNGPVSEGSPVNVSFANAPAGSTFSYDFNNDGYFGELGDAANVTNASQSYTFDNHDTYTVHGQVTLPSDQTFDFYTPVTVNDVPPVPSITQYGDPIAGHLIAFSALAIDPDGDDEISYSWSATSSANLFSDTGTSDSYAFTPPEPGNYTIVLTANNGTSSQSTSLPLNVVANGPAMPTQLEATESLPGEVDLAWVDDATDATAYIITVTPPTGTPTTYSVEADTFTCAVTDLTPNELYAFSVAAQESFPHESPVASSVATVTAEASADALTASGPTTILENSIASLSLDSGSASDISSWTVTWTDVNGGLISTDTVTGSSGSDAYPTYEIPKIIAAITAEDSAGTLFNLPDFKVDVVPNGFVVGGGGPSVLINAENINATATEEFSGEVATFTSNDTGTVQSTYEASIAWGDGNVSPGEIVSLGNDVFRVTGAHTFAHPEVDDLTVTVDDNAKDPAYGLGTATIADKLTIAQPATAVVEDDGITVDLSALGNDAGGPDRLEYEWSATSDSGATVIFNDNGDNTAQDTFATLSALGEYTFTVKITNDSSETQSSSITKNVTQVQTSVNLTAPETNINDGASIQLTATALDQFGNSMVSQPAFHWSSGENTYNAQDTDEITQSGLYTPPAANYSNPVYIVAYSLTPSYEASSYLLHVIDPTQFSAVVVPDPDEDVALLTVPSQYYSQIQDQDSDIRYAALQVKTDVVPWELAEYLSPPGESLSRGFAAEFGSGTYQFRIATCSYQNIITYSSVVSAAMHTVFTFNPNVCSVAAPQRVTAIPSLDGTTKSIHLAWEVQSFAATGLEIDRSIDGGNTYTPLATNVSAADDSYIDNNIPAGDVLEYRIRAFNNISNYSSADAYSNKQFYPVAPTIISASWAHFGGQDNPGVTIFRTDNNGAGVSADDEILQWSSDGTNFQTISSGEPGDWDDDTSPTLGTDKMNYYRIIQGWDGYDASGAGPFKEIYTQPSNVISISVPAAPIAVDDPGNPNLTGTNSSAYHTAIGKTLNVSAADGILSNDYDPQKLSLSVLLPLETQPKHGSVTVNSDGSFIYTPNAGYSGPDSFTYANTNGQTSSYWNEQLVSGVAEVDIDVSNQAVVTQPDTYHIALNQTLTVGSGSLASNDTNPDNANVTYLLSSGSASTVHGTLSLNSDGSFTYIPNTGYVGLDSFTYEVTDGTVTSNPSLVVISVGAVTYTPPSFPSGPVTHIPIQMSSFPNSLQGMWDSWQAAKDKLGSVVQALANFGHASAACKTITDATAGTSAAQELIDSASAAQAIVTQAYDTYTVAQQAAVSTAGAYLGSFHPGVYVTFGYYVGQAVSAINALPTKVLGIGPSEEQLANYTTAFQKFADGASFFVSTSTFIARAAQQTHDQLEGFIQKAGLATIAVSGAELLAEEGCAKFVQYTVQQIVNTAASAVVAQVSQDAIALAAQFSGLHIDPDYLRIGADSMQLFFLVKAARAEKVAEGANCFAGDTQVQTINHGEQSISQIQVGERVATSVLETPDNGGPVAAMSSTTAVDPATWREVLLAMTDPSTPGDSYNMTLLEPVSWITANSAATGSWINLDLPELQISGEAQVVGIDACPSIESGTGQVVLGTFEHISNDVVDVNLVGESQPLQVTSGHKLWSLDADGWVDAGNLHAGEHLAGVNGAVVVQSVTAGPQSIPVYNLDVENDHRYMVTQAGVLAHNVNPCDIPEGIPNDYQYNDDNNGVDKIVEQNVGRYQNNLAHEGQLPGIKSVQGNGNNIVEGTVNNPDYKIQYTDGGTGYGDLYIADPGETNIAGMIGRIKEKVGQTDNGVIFVKVKESKTAFNLSLFWAVIRKEVLAKTDVRGIIVQEPNGSIFRQGF